MTSSFSTTQGLVAVPGTGFKFPEVRDVKQSGDEGRKPELLGSNWLEPLLGSLRALLSQHQKRYFFAFLPDMLFSLQV